MYIPRLIKGTFDQSYIPHAIAYSACIGEYSQRCNGIDNYTVPQTSCISPEVSSVSAAGAPVVIASSVMADDSARTKSSATIKQPLVAVICILVLLNSMQT